MRSESGFFSFAIDEIKFNVTIADDDRDVAPRHERWQSCFLSKLSARRQASPALMIPKHWLYPFGDLRCGCSLVRLEVDMECRMKFSESDPLIELYPSFAFNDFDFGFVPACLDPENKLRPNCPAIRILIRSCKCCSRVGSGVFVFAFKPEDDVSKGYAIVQDVHRGWTRLRGSNGGQDVVEFQKRLDEVIFHNVDVPVLRLPFADAGDPTEVMRDFVKNGKLTDSVDYERLRRNMAEHMMNDDGALFMLEALQIALGRINAQFMCLYDTPFTKMFYDALDSFLFRSNCEALDFIANEMPNFMKSKYVKGDSVQIAGWFPCTKEWNTGKFAHTCDPFGHSPRLSP